MKAIKNNTKSFLTDRSVVDGPELVIGLIGPVGTDLSLVIEHLTDSLKRFNYQSETIRLSTVVQDVLGRQALESSEKIREDHRINALMDAGNELRDRMQHGGALAFFAAAAIRLKRLELHGDGPDSVHHQENRPVSRTAYVLNSLKHPQEIETLRKIYGESFIALGIYHPRHKRQEALVTRIAEGCSSSHSENFAQQAMELIARDEHTPDDRFGQNVRKAFPMADIFISETKLNDVHRAVDLLFSHPFTTPTRDESGMFHAKAASLRSADLSRQVGAVIANDEGEILAIGCNEVPKAGGGCYWEGDLDDSRDFRGEGDINVSIKQTILAEILDELKEANWLSDDYKKKSVDKLLKEVNERERPLFENARVSSLLEFGRIVHAEMNALMDAVRRGVSVKGAVLYCTTFPCHMCARHIISAGIKKVIYIEPYPKSMASEMYKKAIVVEGQPEEHPENAVQFESFVGIAPSRYMDFFTKSRRKTPDGAPVYWRAGQAVPEAMSPPIGVYDVEIAICAMLADICNRHDFLRYAEGMQLVLNRARTVYDKWAVYQKQAIDVSRILGLGI